MLKRRHFERRHMGFPYKGRSVDAKCRRLCSH